MCLSPDWAQEVQSIKTFFCEDKFTSIHRFWVSFLAASAQDSSWFVFCGRAGAPALLHIQSPQQLCPCLSRFIRAFLGSEMWWILFVFYSGSYNLSITFLSVSPLQQSFFYSLSDAGFYAHVIEMYFLVCLVCMWMIPCAIKDSYCMLYL